MEYHERISDWFNRTPLIFLRQGRSCGVYEVMLTIIYVRSPQLRGLINRIFESSSIVSITLDVNR